MTFHNGEITDDWAEKNESKHGEATRQGWPLLRGFRHVSKSGPGVSTGRRHQILGSERSFEENRAAPGDNVEGHPLRAHERRRV
jgi:hypothetical protein